MPLQSYRMKSSSLLQRLPATTGQLGHILEVQASLGTSRIELAAIKCGLSFSQPSGYLWPWIYPVSLCLLVVWLGSKQMAREQLCKWQMETLTALIFSPRHSCRLSVGQEHAVPAHRIWSEGTQSLETQGSRSWVMSWILTWGWQRTLGSRGGTVTSPLPLQGLSSWNQLPAAAVAPQKRSVFIDLGWAVPDLTAQRSWRWQEMTPL